MWRHGFCNLSAVSKLREEIVCIRIWLYVCVYFFLYFHASSVPVRRGRGDVHWIEAYPYVVVMLFRLPAQKIVCVFATCSTYYFNWKLVQHSWTQFSFCYRLVDRYLIFNAHYQPRRLCQGGSDIEDRRLAVKVLIDAGFFFVSGFFVCFFDTVILHSVYVGLAACCCSPGIAKLIWGRF